jgi:hypothetical protein
MKCLWKKNNKTLEPYGFYYYRQRYSVASDNNYEVSDKLLKIMNMICEKGEVPYDFRKNNGTPYKKGDKLVE